MRILLLLCFLAGGAIAQPVMPFSPAGGGAGGSGNDANACQLAGGLECTMAGVVVGAAGSAGAPSFSSPSSGNDGVYFPASNAVSVSVDGIARLTLSTGSSSLDSTLVLRAPAGTAALPSFTWTADPNTGFFNSGTDNIFATTGGTLRLTIGSSTLTSTTPVLGPAGTAALPAHSFSGDPNSGLYSAAADDLGFSVNGVGELLLNASALRPLATGGLTLGTAALLWGDVFTSGVKGNNTTVTIAAGSTATSAQGTVVAGYADTVDDAAALRIQTATGGGSSAVGVQALIVSEGGTTHTDLERIDSTGAGLWGVRTGTVQVGAFGANTVGSAPAGLVTCTSALNGTLAIKTDTDTAVTAPALCLCSRDNAATTYSWKAVSVGTLTGSCP